MLVGLTLKLIGEVQGVNFRYYTAAQARRLKLTGWVRNARDGSVTIVAEGERANLEQLRDWCRQGPATAQVRELVEQWGRAEGEFGQFEIRW